MAKLIKSCGLTIAAIETCTIFQILIHHLIICQQIKQMLITIDFQQNILILLLNIKAMKILTLLNIVLIIDAVVVLTLVLITVFGSASD